MKLEVRNLKKKYGKKEVLKDINFTFEEGKIYGLLGRNGAGKTTFFNALNEDITIDSGKFILDDEFGVNQLKTSDIGYVVSTPIVPELFTENKTNILLKEEENIQIALGISPILISFCQKGLLL